MAEYLLREKKASFQCGYDPDVARFWIRSGRDGLDDLRRVDLVVKMARDLRTSVADAELVADAALRGAVTAALLRLPGEPLTKEAAARWLHEDYDFEPEGYDTDFNTPVSYPDQQNVLVESQRSSSKTSSQGCFQTTASWSWSFSRTTPTRNTDTYVQSGVSRS